MNPDRTQSEADFRATIARGDLKPTATQRSRARYQRAAYTIPPVTLTTKLHGKLNRLVQARGCSVSDFVRSAIRRSRVR